MGVISSEDERGKSEGSDCCWRHLIGTSKRRDLGTEGGADRVGEWV